MTRVSQTENKRRLRNEEKRDPVEHAFRALAALSAEDRTTLFNQFNEVFAEVKHVPSVQEVKK